MIQQGHYLDIIGLLPTELALHIFEIGGFSIQNILQFQAVRLSQIDMMCT